MRVPMSTSKSKIWKGTREVPQDMGVRRSIVEIDSLAALGKGVGRVDGKVWLVEGAFPGERVEAHIRSDRGRFVEAVATTILRPAAGRRTPICPVQATCGGCPWMPLDEADQRAWKRQIVVDALERIGRLPDPPVEPVRAAGGPLRYRNRVEFTIGHSGSGGRMLGLHPAGSATEVVDVDGCHLQSEEADAILRTIREFILAGPGRADRGWDDASAPVRVSVRVSGADRTATVVFRGGSAPIGTLASLADRLVERHPEVRGVVHIAGAPGRRGGGTVEVVRGEGRIHESSGGVSVRVPAGSFTQVQEEGGAILAGLVAAEAAGARCALELYGGTGPFGLSLARRGVRVTVVEADRAAVEAGREAAERAGIAGRIDYVRGRAEDVLARFASEAKRPDLLVADPPRAGLGEALAARVASLGADRIILVSCDPATFARDARVLVREGYRLERVVPVDLFPQTPHVETVARFKRTEADLPRSRPGPTPPRESG
jgi:23S rRNA (uracil1939-C5)-methyltransferase